MLGVLLSLTLSWHIMDTFLECCDLFMLLLLFSCYIIANTLRPHGLQHLRLRCLPLSPGVSSNSCPLSQWCYLTASSSAALFFCLQSFPASGSFPKSWLFASCSQSVGVSVSASGLPMHIQGWFPLGLTGLISVQDTLKSLLQHHSSKASVLWHSAFFMVQLISMSMAHLIHTWLLEKS